MVFLDLPEVYMCITYSSIRDERRENLHRKIFDEDSL